MTAFDNATQKPYGHLVVDLKQDTPDQYRLRPNVIKESTAPKAETMCHTGSIGQSHSHSPALQIDQNHHSASNTDVRNYPCFDCGVLYASPMDLTRHCKRGCPEQEMENKKPRYDQDEWVVPHREDIETNDWYKLFYEDDPDGDESVWDNLLNKAYDAHDNEYQEKVHHYMDKGMPEKAARKKSCRDLRSQYRKTLVKKV